MRDDLLEAEANIDWVESQFNPLETELYEWARVNLYPAIEELPSDSPNSLVVILQKTSLPLSLNVRVGTYLNVIRSALDLLASALAIRHNACRVDKAYFPVAHSADRFARGDYKGSELVNGLPAVERAKIEALKPYQGGNELLWSLHNLDIVRKHRRLLAVAVNPAHFVIRGQFAPVNFTPIATGWISVNDKTVLGLIPKETPKPEMEFAGYIALTEAGPLSRQPVVMSLLRLSALAREIIAKFDG